MTGNQKNSSEEKSRSRFHRLLSMVENHAETVPDDLPQKVQVPGKIYQVDNIKKDQQSGKLDLTQESTESDERDQKPTDPENIATSQSVVSGQTPPSKTPAIDASGMPLPRRVDELDVDATRVSIAAYGRGDTNRIEAASKVSASSKTIAFPQGYSNVNWRKGMGCILRLSIFAVFFFIGMVIIAGSFVFYQYNKIASTLPNVYELRQRAAQFETTRILDRNGNLLYEIVDPTAGRRSYVPLEKNP